MDFFLRRVRTGRIVDKSSIVALGKDCVPGVADEVEEYLLQAVVMCRYMRDGLFEVQGYRDVGKAQLLSYDAQNASYCIIQINQLSAHFVFRLKALSVLMISVARSPER